MDSAELAELAGFVREAGGAPIGGYHEPLGGRPLLLACLPIAAVQPTPFQRDLSPTHTQRLAQKIDEAAAFLDPLIVVRGQDGGFWTPNGRHRLAAAKVLGLRQITVLISPDETLAYRILALNTEKAHNLRDRSLEAIRMARSLAKRQGQAHETDYAAQFESAELLTLGIAYEQVSRFAGGAYSAFLKKVDRFSARTLAASLREREGFAARLRDIDTRVTKLVARAAGARLQVSLSAQLHRGANQPGPLPQGEERRHRAPDAAFAGTDAHDRRGQKFPSRVGVELRSGVGGRGAETQTD